MEEKLSRVYNLLSQIPVAGDNVERMAAAKTLLREVFREVGGGGYQDGGQKDTGPSKS